MTPIAQAEARAYAVNVLRNRADDPQFDRARFAKAIEGAGGPGEPGWLVRTGTMYVPGHLAQGTHQFRLSDLFDALDNPQTELFA